MKDMCPDCRREIRLQGSNKLPGYTFVNPAPTGPRCFRCYHKHLSSQPTVKDPAPRLNPASIVDGFCRYCKKVSPSSSCMFGVDLRRKYKINCADYYNLLASQGNRCKVCRATEDNFARRLHVDHDHSCCPGNRSCGKCIRGLLCPNCNIGLGKIKDDVAIIQSMIDYLAVDTAF